MCLAVPGEIIEIDGTRATVDYGGTRKEARIDLVDARVGDWVLVHAGYAINTLSEKEARKTLGLLEEAL